MKAVITKHFGDSQLFDNLVIDIPEGKVTRLCGPSGRGKTTLMRILSGLEKPDEGSDVRDFSGKTFSWVFQEDRLTDAMSAYSNVFFAIGSSADRNEIMSAFKEMNLPDPMQKVREYSGGMKRRVAIIRAFLSDGQILLLDEPFTGLDRDTGLLVCRFIEKHRRGRTMIIVSHEDDEFLPHCDNSSGHKPILLSVGEAAVNSSSEKAEFPSVF